MNLLQPNEDKKSSVKEMHCDVCTHGVLCGGGTMLAMSLEDESDFLVLDLGFMRARAFVMNPDTSSTGGYLNRRCKHAVYSLPRTDIGEKGEAY